MTNLSLSLSFSLLLCVWGAEWASMLIISAKFHHKRKDSNSVIKEGKKQTDKTDTSVDMQTSRKAKNARTAPKECPECTRFLDMEIETLSRRHEVSIY